MKKYKEFTYVSNLYKKSNLVSGFTLIELLVVIAIIGILSTIVITSLDGGKDKAKDAVVKANLKNAQTQAEMAYYTRINYPLTYRDIGKKAGNSDWPFMENETIKSPRVMFEAAATARGIPEVRIAINPSTNDWSRATWASMSYEDSKWIMEVALSGSTTANPRFWCVDYNGISKETNLQYIVTEKKCRD